MTRRVYLYFAVTFVLGTILGAAGVYYYGWSSGHWHHSFNRERAVARLKNKLHLDEQQEQQVRQIFDEGAEKIRDLQNQTAPQFQALREETRNRIRAILNSDQAKKFDELVKEIDERHRRHASPPPHPPR